jgi:iron complex outermembrane receptor protein
MRKMTNSLMLFFMLMVTALIAKAQPITGRVIDGASQAPVSGASIKIAGTRLGTTTDKDGKFTINAPANAQLEITFVGYESKRVAINGQTEISVSLSQTVTELGQVLVSVGTRNLRRTLTTTPLPVDIFSSSDLKSTGQPSFDKALQYRVPSFNTVNTPVNDATSLLDPYEIRNLGPSRTLILINGKRKNSSSLVYIQQSPGRGESGADISAIPTDAIKRVEILRDGASAQYGSDAIAGVMNIILKDRYDNGSVTLNTGVTHTGDGGLLGISLNNVATIGDKGFLNYTVNFQQQQQANRAGNVNAIGEEATFGASASDVEKFLALKPDAGNINGQPKTTSAKFLINSAIPIGNSDAEFYFNAAYVYKKVNSHANYRTPYWRPTDYGLLTPAGQPYEGYVPTFDGDLNDYNGTIGVRKDDNGWKSDLSLTVGGNKQLYSVSNTVNRNLGSSSPTSFHPGGYSFNHVVGNIDVTKSITDDINIGLGSEFRAENYQLFAGDTASYVQGGADSFAGIAEPNATKNNRYNFGGYVDLAYDITKDFLINGTARLENYSDFGNAFVWKFSSRYKFANDKITLRSSISTGFRAPSLHQIYNQISQYSFVNGTIQVSGIINNVSKEAFLLGVPKLKAENSVNFTAGIGLNPIKNLSITLDYYNITIDNRIVLSSSIGPTGDSTQQLDKVLKNNGIVSAAFWVNGLKTRTQGLDFVANLRNIYGGRGKFGINLAGNYTIENKRLGNVYNPPLIQSAGESVVNPEIEHLLFTSRPKYKAILGIDYTIGIVSFNLNNTLFGPTEFQDLEGGIDPSLKIAFTPKVVTDLGVNIEVVKNLFVAANVSNIFNVMPQWKFVSLSAGGDAILKDPSQTLTQWNNITFDGRYPYVTYNGAHFSQLGAIFSFSITKKF